MRLRFLALLALAVLLGGGSDESLLQAARDCQTVSSETGLPADAGCPGPFAVAHAEYNSAEGFPQGVTIAGVGEPVDLWGLVSYPQPFPAQPAPLVLVLHGNQGTCGAGFSRSCRHPVLHHEGFLYLIDHLASQGFVAVSVNANRLNDGGFDRVLDRAHLLLEHLRRWARWAGGADGPLGRTFAGRVDLTRVGLIGHSRGGEAAIAAYDLGQAAEEPFAIRAVMAIAPTDKRGLSIRGVPFYALVPACDGDVLDYRGVRFFDRALRETDAEPSPQQLAFALGANHDHFNSLWGTDGGCTGLSLIPRAQQERLAQTLSAAFLRRYLLGEAALSYVFTGDKSGPSTPDVPLWRSYADPLRLELDRFDHGPGGPNLLGGRASWEGFRQSFTCGPELERACSPAFVDETSVLALEWLRPGAAYRTEFPGGLDASAYTHLALRVAQNPDDARLDALEPGGRVIHFSLALEDADGSVARVSTEAVGGVPFPVGSSVRDPQTGRFLLRNLLITLRFPLKGFRGVDLSRLSALTLRFDRSPRGSLYLTDPQLTR